VGINSSLRRGLRIASITIGALVGLFLLSFAVPLPLWRTGEQPAPPLPSEQGGPPVEMPHRLWIDTDAACGHARETDPDDCFALLLLVRAPDFTVVGISTSFGNAPLEITDRTTRALMEVLADDGVRVPPVYRGAQSPRESDSNASSDTRFGQPAYLALRAALEAQPLTIVSLGPLTNVAAALADRPDLQTKVGRLVAVMGRRPGHLFHPAEGRGSGGILFGHGPVFRDFNFDQDREAATAVLNTHMPISFVPYDAAREVMLTRSDLSRMQSSGGAAAWVAARAMPWLDYWEKDIGLPGFYPFDALAAAYVMEPELFDCARTTAWIGQDEELWNVLYNPAALLIGPSPQGEGAARAIARSIYCTGIHPHLHDWLMARLAPLSAMRRSSRPSAHAALRRAALESSAAR